MKSRIIIGSPQNFIWFFFLFCLCVCVCQHCCCLLHLYMVVLVDPIHFPLSLFLFYFGTTTTTKKFQVQLCHHQWKNGEKKISNLSNVTLCVCVCVFSRLLLLYMNDQRIYYLSIYCRRIVCVDTITFTRIIILFCFGFLLDHDTQQ